MKLKCLFLLFLISFGRINGQVKYVTTVGSATNNGDTEATSWSLTHAFANAKPGDFIHVKAGNYGDEQYEITVSGTVRNPVVFKGYQKVPNDITTVDGQGGSIVYTVNSQIDPTNSSVMPLILEDRVNDVGYGEGIRISGSFVQLENFQVKYFRDAVVVNGTDNVTKNVLTFESGIYNPKVWGTDEFGAGLTGKAQGQGFVVTGDRHKTINCTAIKSGVHSMKFQFGDSQEGWGNRCYNFNDSNPTDYMYLIANGVTNRTDRNIYAHREVGAAHESRGIVYHCNAPSNFNSLDGFEIWNTFLEYSYPLVQNNTAKNGILIRETAEVNNNNQGGINIKNEAKFLTFENIHLVNTAIWIKDQSDGLFGDVVGSGEDIVFNNITGEVVTKPSADIAAINFIPKWHEETTSPTARRIKFQNCKFDNYGFLFMDYHDALGIELTDCTFKNIKWYNRSSIDGQRESTLDVKGTNNNLENCGFSFPNGFTGTTKTSTTGRKI